MEPSARSVHNKGFKQESDMVTLIFWKKAITLVSVWKMSWQGPDSVLIVLGPILGTSQETPHTAYLSIHDNTRV